MRRNKCNGSVKRKTGKIEDKDADNTPTEPTKVDSVDEENQGFGGWLRSADGLDTMKLFVIANSIVMLTTLGFPQMQTAFNIVYEMIYGEDSLY